jgi:hypothetical protein
MVWFVVVFTLLRDLGYSQPFAISAAQNDDARRPSLLGVID